MTARRPHGPELRHPLPLEKHARSAAGWAIRSNTSWREPCANTASLEHREVHGASCEERYPKTGHLDGHAIDTVGKSMSVHTTRIELPRMKADAAHSKTLNVVPLRCS